MLRICRIVLGLISVLVWMEGCQDVPKHGDAWLSFKYGLHCGDFDHCPGLQDISEATKYYQSIGIADPSNYDLNQWFSDNGFVDGAPVVRGVYANLGDLQIGRDMNCLPQGTKVACYVNNFGPPPTLIESDWPDIKTALENMDGTHPDHPFATVAMVYDSAITGPNQVSFYGFTFQGDPSFPKFGSSPLAELVALDGDQVNEQGFKSVPRMCMACHGGTYDKDAHSVTGASFLPFDVFYFRYSGKDG